MTKVTSLLRLELSIKSLSVYPIGEEIISSIVRDFEDLKSELNKKDKYENFDNVFKAYKKRQKALQRRNTVEHLVNKRLVNLLSQCQQEMPKGLLKDLVNNELEIVKYKYY